MKNQKPRIKKISAHVWSCKCLLVEAEGLSAPEAYNSWLIKSIREAMGLIAANAKEAITMSKEGIESNTHHISNPTSNTLGADV